MRVTPKPHLVYWLSAATVCLSSALLFSVQLIVGKSLLPYFGGAPLLWSLVVMFFQLMLLAGYFYVHLSTRYLTLKYCISVHALLVLGGVLTMPVSLVYSARWYAFWGPYVYVIILLLTSIALPFFVLSSTSPLLQTWLADSGRAGADNPFTLYAASNTGSIVALIGYPLLLEPTTSVVFQQRVLWPGLFYVLAGMLMLCALCRGLRPNHGGENGHTLTADNAHDLDSARKLTNGTGSSIRLSIRWMILSFIPSSLMLAVTLYVSNEMSVAPGPYFWVITLTIYLLSFVVAFSHKEKIELGLTIKLMAVFAILSVPHHILDLSVVDMVYVLINLLLFGSICLASHGLLYNSRPSHDRLTVYYLYIAAGGGLGGIFSSLLAPSVFRGVIEYPFMVWVGMLVVAGLWKNDLKSYFQLEMIRHMIVAGVMILALTVPYLLGNGLSVVAAFVALWCTGAVVALWRSVQRVTALVFVVLVVFTSRYYLQDNVEFIKRDFFGINRVLLLQDERYMVLMHGNTVQGKQNLHHDELIATTYYHRNGPLGDFFRRTHDVSDEWRVAAAGLGIGSMLAYSRPEQKWVYYEISPTVIEIASNPHYFGFVSTYQPRIEQGDARLLIDREDDGAFDLIVLDAYNSNNIPVHLLTREAFDVYLAKLAPGGFIAANIMNRSLNLIPVFAALADHTGLYAVVKEDFVPEQVRQQEDRYSSVWVVLSDDERVIGLLGDLDGWRSLANEDGFPVWTDDYSSILRVMRVFERTMAPTGS